MERTQLYLTPEQKKAVMEIGKAKSMTMAEVVREAVQQYLVHEKRDYRINVVRETFGSLSESDSNIEEHVEDLRKGWQKRLSSSLKENDG